MDEKNSLITFCILHTTRLDCTKQCIEAIERYTNVKYCIKLLRQGYTDEEAETYFKELEKRDYVEVIRSARNLGVSAGRKLLVDKANTPLRMTLDNDVYVTESWLKPILEILEDNKDIGFVGIPIYKFSGELDGIGGRIIKIVGNVVYVETPKMEDMKNKDFIYVDDVAGGVTLFKQEAKSDFAYDPQYFVAFEDLDKGLQLLGSRWKKVVCLRSRVIHDQIKDLNYTAFRMNYPEISRSYARFRKKWGLRLPWRKHVMHKYVYPSILPPFYKTLHKIKDILVRR